MSFGPGWRTAPECAHHPSNHGNLTRLAGIHESSARDHSSSFREVHGQPSGLSPCEYPSPKARWPHSHHPGSCRGVAGAASLWTFTADTTPTTSAAGVRVDTTVMGIAAGGEAKAYPLPRPNRPASLTPRTHPNAECGHLTRSGAEDVVGHCVGLDRREHFLEGLDEVSFVPSTPDVDG